MRTTSCRVSVPEICCSNVEFRISKSLPWEPSCIPFLTLWATRTKSSNSPGCNWGPAINIIGIPTAPETSSRCSESSPRTAFPGLLSRFHSGSWPAVRNCPRDSVIPLQRIGIKAANISADSSVVKNQPHTCRIPFELPWVIRARESVLTLPLHQAMFLRSIVS